MCSGGQFLDNEHGHYFLTSLFTELSILSQVQQLYYKAEVSSASNLIKIMKLNVKKIFKAILFNHRVLFHQIDRFVRKIKPVKTPDILDRYPPNKIVNKQNCPELSKLS